MKKRYNIETYKETQSSNKYAYYKAKKRVNELKGFYWHFFWYLVINLFLTGGKIYRNIENVETLNEAFLDTGTFGLWFFWGIGVSFHFIGVFGKNLFLGKEWEERKVQEYLAKEEKQNWK